MSGKDGEEDHTWPAFVDALTTMTMILTFVMLILAVGIASMSQNVGRYIIEAIGQAIQNGRPGQPPQTTEEIVREIERMRQPAPIQSSPVETERRIQANETPERAPDARPVQATRSQAALTLIYQQRQHRLDEAAQNEVRSFVTESQEVRDARVLEVRAAATPTAGALSEARRLAYYRGMLVRAELMRHGIAADRITVRVDERVSDQEPESVRVFARP